MSAEREAMQIMIYEHAEGCPVKVETEQNKTTLRELTNEKGTGMVDVMWKKMTRFENWLFMGFLALLGAAILNFVSAQNITSKAQAMVTEEKTDQAQVAVALKGLQEEVKKLRESKL